MTRNGRSSASIRWIGSRPMAAMGLVAVAGLMATSLFQWDWVAGDPLAYHQLMATILGEGRVPYFEAPFEHLPGMLAPMAAVWFAGGSSGPFLYRGIWAMATAVVLLACTRSMGTIGDATGTPGLQRQWILVSAPLVPIVLFRTEPWVVLAAILALGAMLESRSRAAGAWTFVGILAKGWPVVVALGGLARRRLAWPLIAIIAGASVLVPVVAADGFTSVRGFQGLHAESVGGSLGGLWQTLTGGDVRLVEAAGAAYVELSPSWGLVGLALAALIGVRLIRARLSLADDGRLILGLGAVLGAVLLSAPLQSTQFLFWITPFVAVSRSWATRAGAVAFGSIGLINLIFFESMVFGDPWWFASVVMRNAILFWVALRLAGEARRFDIA